MIAFDAIEKAAIAHVGDAAELEARLTRPEPPETLAMVGNDRYLSVMSRRIFRAGLKHALVDARWPAFEVAFDDFDVDRVAALDDSDIQQLARDDRLIRHRSKLLAVRDNARAMQTIIEEFGSFGFWIADWPEEEIVDLWHELRRRFSQLGGNSAPAFLRMAGKDTFLLTDWVIRALHDWKAFKGRTSSRTAHNEIQAIFNQWRKESDFYLCQFSQILAFSIGR